MSDRKKRVVMKGERISAFNIIQSFPNLHLSPDSEENYQMMFPEPLLRQPRQRFFRQSF